MLKSRSKETEKHSVFLRCNVGKSLKDITRAADFPKDAQLAGQALSCERICQTLLHVPFWLWQIYDECHVLALSRCPFWLWQILEGCPVLALADASRRSDRQMLCMTSMHPSSSCTMSRSAMFLCTCPAIMGPSRGQIMKLEPCPCIFSPA